MFLLSDYTFTSNPSLDVAESVLCWQPTLYTYFDLLQGKSSACSKFAVVFDSWASNNWSQRSSNWSGLDSDGFQCTLVTSPLFTCRLVEPCFHVPLPILMEMGIRYHIITFGRHDCAGKDTEKRSFRQFSQNIYAIFW